MQNILEHYKNPENFGVLENYTHKKHSLNVSCGDEVTVYMLVLEDTIKDLKFEARGCAISVAALSMLSEELIGMSVSQAMGLDKDFVLDLLGIDVGVVRLKCALIGMQALQQVLSEFVET